ncbi:MAG: nitroreductase family protein [Candidatus Korobacteraceae bacterium]|jgi:nitroreductase
MDFFALIHARQSVRAYQPRPVEAEKLAAMLEAANRAPSAGNYQAFEIYVVNKQKQIETLTAATFGQDFMRAAPLCLVFCMAPARCQYQPAEVFAMQDTSIACTFSMLAATELGLSSCWVGAFSPEKLAQALALPAGATPVAVLAVGYAAETPERTPRRPIGEVAHRL